MEASTSLRSTGVYLLTFLEQKIFLKKEVNLQIFICKKKDLLLSHVLIELNL